MAVCSESYLATFLAERKGWCDMVDLLGDNDGLTFPRARQDMGCEARPVSEISKASVDFKLDARVWVPGTCYKGDMVDTYGNKAFLSVDDAYIGNFPRMISDDGKSEFMSRELLLVAALSDNHNYSREMIHVLVKDGTYDKIMAEDSTIPEKGKKFLKKCMDKYMEHVAYNKKRKRELAEDEIPMAQKEYAKAKNEYDRARDLLARADKKLKNAQDECDNLSKQLAYVDWA